MAILASRSSRDSTVTRMPNRHMDLMRQVARATSRTLPNWSRSVVALYVQCVTVLRYPYHDQGAFLFLSVWGFWYRCYFVMMSDCLFTCCCRSSASLLIVLLGDITACYKVVRSLNPPTINCLGAILMLNC